ncbi:MAG: TlpA family protein disulfide reductase [Myxococcales bacterium]|nr:TlpA family protein disulfide reductase [Myxococcales bacterium]
MRPNPACSLFACSLLARPLLACSLCTLLGCAPPPVFGDSEDDGTSAASTTDPSADGSSGADSTEAPPSGDLDPDQLDRSEDLGACGYPGPGPSGYGTEVGQRIANNTTQLLENCFDEAVQLADFMCPRPSGKSNRAILVNIGAGWCLPCQAETLEFPELYAEYHDQGLEIVQVMFQDWEALAPTGSFCDEWSSGDWSSGSSPGVALEFPVLIDQVFDWGSIYLQDPASATPINMLIDANGNIRWKLVGQQPPLDVLRAQIELVIEEPYAPPA